MYEIIYASVPIFLFNQKKKRKEMRHENRESRNDAKINEKKIFPKKTSARIMNI